MDRWLLNKVDCATLKLQRKGYLLTTAHVNVAGVTFISTVLHASLLSSNVARAISIMLCGAVWGSYLWGTTKWAHKNQDYPQSVRMVERLNAKALRSREMDKWIRVAFLWLSALQILAFPAYLFEGDIIKGFTSAIGTLSPTLGYYLNGCSFIGPGEFAKQQQEHSVQNAATNSHNV